MQVNSDLINSLLGLNTGGELSSGVKSNELGAEVASSEFLSLLNETKGLAESGVSPTEFIEGLGDEELGLSGKEKKALAKSFMDHLPQELKAELLPEALGEKNTNSKISKLIQKNPLENQEVKQLQTQGNLELSEMPSELVQKKDVLPGELKSLEQSLKTPTLTSEEISLAKGEKPVLSKSEFVDPKISNGKLLSLKNTSNAENGQKINLQSSEDFVNQNKIISKDQSGNAVVKNQTRNSFFPNAKSNKVLAFKKEQQTINKSVFAGKNPFVTKEESPLKASNITSNEGALFEAVESTQGEKQATNMNNFANEIVAPKVNNLSTLATTAASTKVLDLSNIQATNPAQLIDEISGYIATSRLENQESIDLLVKHNTLGNFKIIASKGQLPDQVNLEIAAGSEQGKAFFKNNEVEMIKSLSNSGVKLGDVKVALSGDANMQSSEKGDDNLNQNNNFSSKHGKQFASGRDQSGRERREELWNMYKERLGA